MTVWSSVPWGLLGLLTLFAAVVALGILLLRRYVAAGRPLDRLTAQSLHVFHGVAAEAPKAFRGFAWKFSVTFTLYAFAVLFLSPWILAGFDLLTRGIAFVAAWPFAPPAVGAPDYVSLLFLTLFLTLATSIGLEFELVQTTLATRLRPVLYLVIYLIAAASLDVVFATFSLGSVYTLIPRALLGGTIYTIALLSCLVRPRPLNVTPQRRSRGTTAGFLLCLTASVLSAIGIVLALYPVWIGTANPYLRFAFILLIPSFAYVFFGLYGLLLYLAIERWERRSRPSLEDYHPAVSIIIPAYNEESTIAETLRQADAAAGRYPGTVQIIVGNDGSTDRTSKIARATVAGFHRASGIVLDLPHGGKSSALNAAVLCTTGDIVIRIDADTPVIDFAPLIPYFADRDMGEVQGRVLPLRRRDWISRFRLLEVMWVHAFYRRALLATGTAQVISGNFCAFRRNRVVDAGGWVPWNGEDAEISLRLQRLGYKLRFDMDACASEDTPASLPSLTKQRIRWSRGGYFSHAYHYGAVFGGLEVGALSLYWWMLLIIRGARRYLTLVFAAALSLTLSPYDLVRVAILIGLILVPRMITIMGFLVRWGFWRQLGWTLLWPVFWFLRSYFWLEAVGTMLPGAIPEFSD